MSVQETDNVVAQILMTLSPQLSKEQKQALGMALIESSMLDGVPVHKVQFNFLQQREVN